jgi:hypothetical protein
MKTQDCHFLPEACLQRTQHCLTKPKLILILCEISPARNGPAGCLAAGLDRVLAFLIKEDSVALPLPDLWLAL